MFPKITKEYRKRNLNVLTNTSLVKWVIWIWGTYGRNLLRPFGDIMTMYSIETTYLKALNCQSEEAVINVSEHVRYAKGPGSKKSGRNVQKAKLSCSKTVNIPSKDCTQINSRFWDPPNGPTTKLAAVLRSLCSYSNCSVCWVPIACNK